MNTENQYLKVNIATLLSDNSIRVIDEDLPFVNRLLDHELHYPLYCNMKQTTKVLGVTDNFKQIINEFKVRENETPAGFRIDFRLVQDGVCKADLVRDISYDKNGVKRPTKFLFSADSANPYEIEAMKGVIANLTCNPAIIYNRFINNASANIGGRYKTRDEVISEIGKILGPGVDISVELNNPFESSEEQILSECEHFSKMISKHRIVIKVPHTGPLNKENINELTSGDKKFFRRWSAGSTTDKMRGHNLALFLHENGYRVNFTLMFEPYQTALALQARPYFINSFIMFRQQQTRYLESLIEAYRKTESPLFIEQMKNYLLENDYIGANEEDIEDFQVLSVIKKTLNHRLSDPKNDGLDSIRHNLRALRRANLPDTRLIICNFQDDNLYPAIDRLIMEDEFFDMSDRLVITNPPELMSAFASSPLVVQFQRRFMNAIKIEKQ